MRHTRIDFAELNLRVQVDGQVWLAATIRASVSGNLTCCSAAGQDADCTGATLAARPQQQRVRPRLDAGLWFLSQNTPQGAWRMEVMAPRRWRSIRFHKEPHSFESRRVFHLCV